jgi:hypothetical protein
MVRGQTEKQSAQWHNDNDEAWALDFAMKTEHLMGQ